MFLAAVYDCYSLGVRNGLVTMLSLRSLASLAQLLGLFDPQIPLVLFAKHGLRLSMEDGAELLSIRDALWDEATSPRSLALLEEVVRTNGELSNRITPRYRFSERFDDLVRCLALDGYLVEDKTIVPLDPSIANSTPIEDDLVRNIGLSNLDHDQEIIAKLNDSAEAFRRNPPDYNACLTNARVALESLARQIASKQFPSDPTSFDPSKWGAVINYLRTQQFFSLEEEKGLVGVYAFLSPGAHRPVGLTEEEACRLGRSLALSMCWYLVKRYDSDMAS